MAKYLLPLLLVCFFIERIQSNDCNFNPKHLVKHGHDLKEHAFWEAKTKGIVECAQSCIRRNKCKSFNFNENSRLCQLNANNWTLSTNDRGWVYSEIGDWPLQVDPHCYNNSCGENEVCVPGNSISAQNCAHSCFNLARTCPLPIGASPDQPRTVGSIFNHACADGSGKQYIAECLENGQWNETIENVCKLCEDGWIPFQDKCYLFDGPAKKYVGAKAFCEGLNSHLLQAETEEENDFVKGQLVSRETNPSVCNNASYSMCCFWNALYQYTDNKNETWTSDGQELTYDNWASNEPGNQDELCTVYFCAKEFKWVDVKCDDRLFQPICEK